MLEAGSAVISVFSFAAAAVEVVNSAADFAVDFESGLRCLVSCLFSPQTLISSNCLPLYYHLCQCFSWCVLLAFSVCF